MIPVVNVCDWVESGTAALEQRSATKSRLFRMQSKKAPKPGCDFSSSREDGALHVNGNLGSLVPAAAIDLDPA